MFVFQKVPKTKRDILKILEPNWGKFKSYYAGEKSWNKLIEVYRETAKERSHELYAILVLLSQDEAKRIVKGISDNDG